MFLKNLLHSLGAAASAVGHFFADAFKWVETDGAKIAVAIIEEIKTILGNPSTGFLASILDTLTHSNIPTDILATLQKELPGALAIATGIQNFPANPTEADIKTLETTVLTNLGVSSDRSQFYSTFGAKTVSIIRNLTMPGQTFTFATLVTAVEAEYQAYLTAKAGDTTGA